MFYASQVVWPPTVTETANANSHCAEMLNTISVDWPSWINEAAYEYPLPLLFDEKIKFRLLTAKTAYENPHGLMCIPPDVLCLTNYFTRRRPRSIVCDFTRGPNAVLCNYYSTSIDAWSSVNWHELQVFTKVFNQIDPLKKHMRTDMNFYLPNGVFNWGYHIKHASQSMDWHKINK
jgi:hypothetical protein